ncbi:SURF1 family protein [Naumannella sp. ID2617S]|nr:SURF1 family protein [Enemella dayhoffiae]NNG20094.1 SURF1 family protein [Naumannella sp. ID2617S]
MKHPTHTPAASAPARRRRQALVWVVGLLVTAVMVGLGLWQMQTFRDQGQDAMRARMTQPAVPLESVVQVGQLPRDGYGRPVVARGSYLPERQVLVPEAGHPGRFRVLTALRLADGTVLPVVRGVVEGDQPPPAPGGRVEQIGLLLPTEAEPETELPPGQLGTVRLPRLAQAWPEQLIPGFVSLGDADATAQGLTPAEVAVPSSAGQARNSGYALQWWIFAIAAIAATVKLSRDAARGTGLMAVGNVDKAGDNAVGDTPDTGDERPASTPAGDPSPSSSADADTRLTREDA